MHGQTGYVKNIRVHFVYSKLCEVNTLQCVRLNHGTTIAQFRQWPSAVDSSLRGHGEYLRYENPSVIDTKLMTNLAHLAVEIVASPEMSVAPILSSALVVLMLFR